MAFLCAITGCRYCVYDFCMRFLYAIFVRDYIRRFVYAVSVCVRSVDAAPDENFVCLFR